MSPLPKFMCQEINLSTIFDLNKKCLKNSKTASKYRSACDPKIMTAALLITEMQSADVFLCKFITLTADSYSCL